MTDRQTDRQTDTHTHTHTHKFIFISIVVRRLKITDRGDWKYMYY